MLRRSRTSGAVGSLKREILNAWRSDILARLRVLDIGALGIGAAAFDTIEVADVHVGKVAKLVSAAADVDIGAVHVELTVTNGVRPGPSHGCLTILQLLGNFERKSVDAFGLAKVTAVRGSFEVAFGDGWAAAFDRVDDKPVGGVLDLLGIGLVCNRDLARTSTMGSSIGTTTELKAQCLS